MTEEKKNNQTSEIAATEEKQGNKFGTFSGVFTPSLLTILGVIMYLRLGWVVGHAGLIGTLIIVTIASAITFLTGLSVSAIATDQKVKAGGAYYMISRSMGIETGGAVGIPLFIAQAFSIPLYTLGFAESVALAFPGVNQKVVGLAVTVFVAVLAIKSAKLAVKAQFFIMAAIFLSFVSLFLGAGVSADVPAAAVEASAKPGFWHIFAVFFPAVTGIMAGINMSGDLKDPKKSIPLGTIAAVLTGYIIYMLLPILLYYRAPTSELISNTMIMFSISRWPALILAGIWGATLSSAIGSILGAPRVLQALARDGVLPRPLRFLGKGSGPMGEPRIGTAVTLVIALVLVYTVNLNTIAPILTMFFLTTYLVLNFAAGVEGFLQNPSFRPSFRVHWGLSILGAAGCLFIMFLINQFAAVIAGLFVLSIYIWLERRKLETAWGDVRRGLWMMLVRMGLLQLDRAPDPRNWRPNILVLAGSPKRRWHLIELADMITYKKGLFTAAAVIPYDSKDAGQRSSLETAIKDYLNKRGVPALVRIISAQDAYTGASKLIEAYGLGPVVPNTVLAGMGDLSDEKNFERYSQMIGEIYISGKNTLILNDDPSAPLSGNGYSNGRIIDVWWGGLEGNGGLMLILADSLRLSPDWKGARLRLQLVVADENAVGAAEENMKNMLAELNINAEYFITDSKGREFNDTFRELSAGADIIFRGMAVPKENYSEYLKKVSGDIEGMPATVLVLSGKDTSFYAILRKE